MQLSEALNPRRIARSLVTVLVLTLIETVVAPVSLPKIATPVAQAVSETVTASTTSGKQITIPAGVFSITIDAVGGSGGKGGDDVNTGGSATSAGHVVTTFAVTPGDVIGLYGGAKGSPGTSGTNTSGGAAGTDTFPDLVAFAIGSTYYASNNFIGGVGGKSGSSGSSGAGGGGGAASIATINHEIVIIAGGGGGGGGAGSGSNGPVAWSGNLNSNGASFSGGAGTDTPNGSCGGSTGNDGGGGGGGGGGFYGGQGGTSTIRINECSGVDGSPGGNYKASRGVGTVDERLTRVDVDGYVTYTYAAEVVTTCAKTTTTNDIYTIEKITYIGNCTWTVPSSVNVIDFFMVGGGGGGGGDGGSGGGGGAAQSRTAIAVTPSSNISLSIGYGGVGGIWGGVPSTAAGRATTLTTAASVVYTANGGSAGNDAPNAVAAAGGTATNGGFAGGAGGISSSCSNTMGGAGKTGISNYYFGSQNTYGGGGGGGTCPSSAAVTAAAGANGGGAGGYSVYANSVYTNFPGSDGINGTGGGGGGGIATGTGLKVNGGKGGSGVILIRYATNAADAFPVSLTGALQQRWAATDFQYLDSTRRGWMDSSGSNSSTRTLSGSTAQIVDAAATNGNSKTFKTLQGATTDQIALADLPTNYTLFHVARYNNGSKGRLITTSSGNWLSGFHSGNIGVSHHNWWMTPSPGVVTNSDNWLLSSDQLKTYRANGRDVTYNQADVVYGQYWYNYVSTSTGFGVNNSNYAEKSDWQVADVIVFNRELSNGETRSMERYLARVYGLTLDSVTQSGETDTALNLDGNQYFYTQRAFGNKINDTFTVEAWINPTSACGAGGTIRCTIFSKEYAVRATIYDGKFGFIMYGTSTVWQWNDTNLKIPINEWHHIALVKRGAANSNGAVEVYLDGQLALVKAGSPYLTSTSDVAFDSANILRQDDDQWVYIGAALGDYDRFRGQLDEVKVWKVARTTSEIMQDMHSSDASNPSLQFYYDFNKSVGSNTENISNLGYGGSSRADLITVGTASYLDVKTTSTTTPYTTITFPRSYITQNGGWKVPTGISLVQTAVIGGGGGAGGGYQGGGGGAGGLIETLTTLVPGDIYPIKVGVGGSGHGNINPATNTPGTTYTLLAKNGETSTAFGMSAIGGGYGSTEFDSSTGASSVNINRIASSGGSGGGGGWGNGASNGAAGISGQGNAGGNISICCTAAGGGGAGSAGLDGTTSKGGDGGTGKFSAVLQKNVAAGGGGSMRTGSTTAAQGVGGSGIGGNSAYTNNAAVGAAGGATNGAYGTGSGGGAGMSTNGSYASFSGSGGSGVVAIRYITALVPAYTKPSNITLDVGQTETFTTNVSQDSATAVLTRTFKWESTTPTSGGTYTTLKVGTGAANAAYGWIPSDTSTTGSGYLYRLTVTDSDTAGLFITDSSTAWATINPAMVITKTSASNILVKKINVSRTETFTITLGTPTYRATLSPVLQGITIDTSTAGVVVLKIGDTATVGTWAETLTVTDSVSAVYNIPLSITVADPPNLLNTSEIVKNGLILNLEAGNSQSLVLADTTTATSVVWKDLSGNQLNAQTSGTYDARTCVAPTYYASYGGYLEFDGVSSCYRAPDVGMSVNKSFSVEAWFRMNSTSWGGSTALVSQNWPSANNINIVLGGLNGTTNLRVGFYNGGWYYVDTGYTPIKGRWTHVIGTYDGASLQLWIDGSRNDSKTVTAGLTGGINNNGYSIGKSWAGGNFFNGSIAAVRIYNRALSAAEIGQNYNATKSRFDSTNQTLIKPTKKYGVVTLESFTATSGQDTKTVTLAVGDRAGIDWDTTTVTNQVNLSVQESLTVGTYYDTMTVTDSLGQSTYLPITFKVTQADTVTVQVRNPVTTVYTGSAPTTLPTVTISGLVGVDTATTSRLYSSPASGLSCATGGNCAIGDTGPGGGKVFYDAGATQSWGRYLEAAPATWAGVADSVTANIKAWCTVSGVAMVDSADIGSLPNGIGQGKANTYASTLNSCDGGAIYLARQYRGGGKSDWYIPTGDELVLMAANTSPNYIRTSLGLIYSASLYGYWGSNINVSGTVGSLVTVGQAWSIGATNRNDSTHNMVRPIRAITPSNASYIYPALVNDTNTPIDVETYTVSASALNFGVGLASNYVNVVYETSTLKITPAYQNKISINLYGAIAGESFTVIASGGSGVGVVSESVTAGGNATGCTVSNHILWNLNSKTDQKYCRIIVTKAASRNYFSDSITADVYFMAYLNGQPTGLMGSGATIALNGETAFSIDTTAPPTITGLSATTISLSAGGTFQITGTGFDLGGLRVKFNRNKYVVFVAGASTIDINVSDIASSGATSGRIAVMTRNGEAISRDYLTILP